MAAKPRCMVWTLHPLEAHNLRKAHTSSQRDTTACRASQCRTRMATVVYEDPIHHISGKISKKYRTTYNYRKQSDRKYTSVHGERDLQNHSLHREGDRTKGKVHHGGTSRPCPHERPNQDQRRLGSFQGTNRVQNPLPIPLEFRVEESSINKARGDEAKGKK